MAWLKRTIDRGQSIKPWLILGPYNQDVSDEVVGLTLYEREGATVGTSLMASVAQEVQELLATDHLEGQTSAFRGEARTWELARRPEKYLLWGTYNISNHLGAALLSNRIEAAAGTYTFELSCKITGRVMLFLDGKPVFDSANAASTLRDGFARWSFQLELDGEHSLSAALLRVGRMAQVGMQLVCTDGTLSAWLPDCAGVSPADRETLETEIASLRLERDMFHPDDDVAIITAADVRPFRAGIKKVDGEPIVSATFEGAGRHVLLSGADLPDGTYSLSCDWIDATGCSITGTSFEIKKVSPVEAPLGDAQLAERQQTALAHFADNPEPRHIIFEAVARYALGRYDEIASHIEYTCAFIKARKDCADFAIQGMLRIMYWERAEQHLPDELNALMKDTVLGFKYWVDEPGDTVMYMGSENHRLLFHVAEWMAGQLFPTEEFTNSGMRGLYHSTKGRMYITEWIRQRGRFGFDEWHSNSYFPISISPLVNVYDFCIHEDSKVRDMAGFCLDQMFSTLAADTFDGILGTCHGRSYGRYIKHPDMEGTSSMCWLLWGTGSLSKGTSGIATALLATSAYRAPAILTKMATDKQTVVESRQRQGMHRAEIQSAEFVVFRTPDYQMAAVQDYRKGEYESSSHPAQVTLGNKNVIFWSCPHTCEEGSGARPDYWSGCTTLPRVIQYRNVMSLTFRQSEMAWMTHCFYEQDRFDEVCFEGNWAFCRVADGYVAIYSQHGYAIGAQGQYAGRELVCTADENTWLIEGGRKADWGSFTAFCEAVLSAEMRAVEGGIAYDSPSVGRFVTGWDITPTVGGEEVATDGYALVDSVWAYSRFGSGEITLSYEDDRYNLWLNQ